MLLLAVFAAVAIALAVIGVHGVLSYTVTRRTPELGLRMALGASHRDIVGLVVGEGLRLALVGLAIGTADALASYIPVRRAARVEPMAALRNE